MAVVVDDGVAEDAVEPRYDLLVRDIGAALEASREGGLEDVLGGFMRFHAAFEEP